MHRTATAAAVALAAAIALGAGTALGGRAPAPECHVGYVDLGTLFKEYKKAKEIVAALGEENKALMDGVLKKDQDLKKRARELQTAAEPGTEAYDRMRNEIDLAGRAIEMEAKSGTAALQRKQVRRMHEVYKEVCTEAQRIAAAKGFTGVLAVDDSPIEIGSGIEMIGANELKLQMALRPVIWHAAECDITKDVLDALNK